MYSNLQRLRDEYEMQNKKYQSVMGVLKSKLMVIFGKISNEE